MYLSRLYIKNYRSIKEVDISFPKGKSVIIGRNNAGKSNIIKAIDLILGESQPTYAKAENITENDFFSWKDQVEETEVVESANELFIWCELVSEEDESLNYEEMYKCYGFYVYSEIVDWEYVGGKKRPVKSPIRLSKENLPRDYASLFEINEDDNNEKDYINPKLRYQQTFEKQFNGKHGFAFAFVARKLEEGQISKDMRFLYRENPESNWILAFKAPIRNELLQSAIIPSFRDPQNQLRISTWTWYGKLMKFLTSEHACSDELQQAFGRVKEIADGIFSNVKNKVTQSTLDVAFPDTELHFQFNADTKMDIYKNCLIYIDDGFKSLLTEKGSGVQSATIIGLFSYYTQFVNTVTSALLCIEEPEVYLHPHARRVISDRLDEFLQRNKNQVILTTHSTEFIRTVGDDLNVILVRKNGNNTIANPLNIKQFKDLLLDNNQNEVFFSDKVIICEGYDDFIIRAVAREIYPKKLDEQNISIISSGSKDNISRFAKLVLKLNIKCFVFADFDYFLRDKQDERKKYEAKAHESVTNLGNVYFRQECIAGENGDRAISAIDKLRRKLKTTNELAFYTAKSVDAFIEGEEIRGMLKKMRENGVCILDAEIEDLSRDKDLLSADNKLSLDKLYELNAKLLAGSKISDIIAIEEISKFLRLVLER